MKREELAMKEELNIYTLHECFRSYFFMVCISYTVPFFAFHLRAVLCLPFVVFRTLVWRMIQVKYFEYIFVYRQVVSDYILLKVFSVIKILRYGNLIWNRNVIFN